MSTQEIIAGSDNRNVAELTKESFPVTGMTCASCASSVESMLAATRGVAAAGVNFASQTAWAEYDPSVATREDLRQSVQSIGYDLIIDADDPLQVQAELQAFHYKDIMKRFAWSAVLTLPVFVTGMFRELGYSH